MKAYLAGPMFTASELEFNRRLKGLLEQAGHEVWLPQEQTAGMHDARETFKILVKALDTSDVVIGNMDGADPDSGTCWECGYAYAHAKPTILFRTDRRSRGDTSFGRYNLMMWASATVRLDGPFSTVDELGSALIASLDNLVVAEKLRERISSS